MKQLTESVRACLESKNWYGALTISLILPDVCGKLEFPNFSVGKRYEKWYETYVINGPSFPNDANGHKYRFPCSSDCYAIRCAILHEGSEEISNTKTRDVMGRYHFYAPEENFMFFGHQCGDLAQLQVDKFSEKICLGVDYWVENIMIKNPKILSRSGDLVRIRSIKKDGFALTRTSTTS